MSTNLEMTRGDDAIFDVAVTLDGVAVDLGTVQAIAFTVKDHLDDADSEAVIRKALGAGIEIDGTTSNVAHISIDAAETGERGAPERLYWDVEITDEDGFIHTVASGRLQIWPDVTRAGFGS